MEADVLYRYSAKPFRIDQGQETDTGGLLTFFYVRGHDDGARGGGNGRDFDAGRRCVEQGVKL